MNGLVVEGIGERSDGQYIEFNDYEARDKIIDKLEKKIEMQNKIIANYEKMEKNYGDSLVKVEESIVAYQKEGETEMNGSFEMNSGGIDWDVNWKAI